MTSNLTVIICISDSSKIKHLKKIQVHGHLSVKLDQNPIRLWSCEYWFKRGRWSLSHCFKRRHNMWWSDTSRQYDKMFWSLVRVKKLSLFNRQMIEHRWAQEIKVWFTKQVAFLWLWEDIHTWWFNPSPNLTVNTHNTPQAMLALGDNPFFNWMNIFFEWIILNYLEWINSSNE